VKLLSNFKVMLLASMLTLPACGEGDAVEETSGGDPGEMGAGSVEEMVDGLGADPTGGTAGPAPAGAGVPGSPDPAVPAGPGAGPAGAPIDTTARTTP
jgi:hypothetical protein